MALAAGCFLIGQPSGRAGRARRSPHGRLARAAPHGWPDFKTEPTVWYDDNIMGHIVIPDQPGPDDGIMDWSRYLSELEKLPQDDGGVQIAIQGARDMIADLEWLKPEGPENPR